MVIYYKVLDKDNHAKDGGNFNYNPYINGALKGQPVPRVENPVKCESGYHLTTYWNMWLSKETDKIYEVEPIDIIVEDFESDVVDKLLCKSFKFIKQVTFKFDDKTNTGSWNTGISNTGDSNTGDRNTGDRNTGNWNTGNSNTGDSNTGDRNTGDRNTGISNTGDSNTGDRNTGIRNTGIRNTGNRNTGDRNTGDRNTGNRNTGDRNTGNWNTGDCNTGSFNTKKPKYTQLFNKNILTTRYEKISFPDWLYFELKITEGLTNKQNYKISFINSFEKATKEELLATTKLPNFNYKIFEEISGITKKDFDKRLKE